MKILVLNLKGKYFDEIKSGVKPFEFRAKNGYWAKRLLNKHYDFVSFRRGYPKLDEATRIITKPYRGYVIQNIKHEHFGNNLIEVFAIYT